MWTGDVFPEIFHNRSVFSRRDAIVNKKRILDRPPSDPRFSGGDIHTSHRKRKRL
jgi:hypothetical protein